MKTIKFISALILLFASYTATAQNIKVFYKNGETKIMKSEEIDSMIFVKVYHVDGVYLDKSSVDVPEGGTVQLTATVTPEDAENKNVTWSSSDENVVTVSNTGLVTAVANGSATITVKTEDGDYMATCSVSVKNIEDCVSVDRTGQSTSIINGVIKYGVTFRINNNSSETIHLTSLAGVEIEQDLEAGQSYSISLQGSTSYIQNYYQQLIFTYKGVTYSIKG